MNIDLETDSLHAQMHEIGSKLRAASHHLATAKTEDKVNALMQMAAFIRLDTALILAENAKDVEAAQAKGITAALLDRLTLTQERVEAIANAIEAIAAFKDPVGDIITQWERPNGLLIQRIRMPLGVIGVIYESRPNVTTDAAALCLMSGNAILLRGGSECFHTNHALYQAMLKAIEVAGLPQDIICLVPTSNRDAVGMMLEGLGGNLDVIIPRGGKNLVARVQKEARIPVFAHLEGLCHLFMDKAADSAMALEIIVNSKMRRTGICGALETLLIHREVNDDIILPILTALSEKGCEIRGDEKICALFPKAHKAVEEDWHNEYLDAILSIKYVDDLEAACAHIAHYGSEHTDGIITEDKSAAMAFFHKVQSAIVIHNASTQFADGGEFGMGAEIGIATGKMHARGPIGVEQLTSFHYWVKGKGQVRP